MSVVRADAEVEGADGIMGSGRPRCYGLAGGRVGGGGRRAEGDSQVGR